MTKTKDNAGKAIRDIRRATHRRYSAEEKIRIVLDIGQGRQLWSRARTDGSHASSNDPGILLGLGSGEQDEFDVRIIWPDGNEAVRAALSRGRCNYLQQRSPEQVKID